VPSPAALFQKQHEAREVRHARSTSLVGVRWWPSVAALAFGAFALRLPYLAVPLSADEGGYATAAYWWARGDTLYQSITITRPQGIFVVFRALDALGLGSPYGIHLVAALWATLSALALLALAARLWGRGIGLGAAALYAAVMATPWVEGYQANAELFMTLPLLLALLALVRADATALAARRGLLWLAASGLLGALALLLKPAAVAVLPLGALWLLRRRAVEGAAWRDLTVALAALAGGWALGLLPALAHGLLTVPDRYLGAVVFYRLGQDSLLGGALAHQVGYAATNTLYLLGHLPLLLLAPFGFRLAAHGGDRGARAASRTFLALWALTALGGVSLGGNWFLHYYQQLLPPLAVAVALVTRGLLRRPLAPPRFAALCLVVCAVLALLFPIARGVVAGVDPATLPEWEPGVAAAAPVAAYLAAHTAPTETVYVAYDHADIYYLAARRPAARWLHFRELGWTPGAFTEQVDRLGDPATAPRYIVGAQAFDFRGFDADGALRAIVARDYMLETAIDGVPLYRRVGK
jgi:4-amino-4-deoxy-L-arabinose transferase-like glycosyltransferase